jgi:hypothetical protein
MFGPSVLVQITTKKKKKKKTEKGLMGNNSPAHFWFHVRLT